MFAYTTAVNILSDVASTSCHIPYNPPIKLLTQMTSHVVGTMEDLGPTVARFSKDQPLGSLLPRCCPDGI